jgi:hypothetical protein
MEIIWTLMIIMKLELALFRLPSNIGKNVLAHHLHAVGMQISFALDTFIKFQVGKCGKKKQEHVVAFISKPKSNKAFQKNPNCEKKELAR